MYGSVLENCIIVRYYLNYCSYTVNRPSVARTLTAIYHGCFKLVLESPGVAVWCDGAG